MLFARFRESLRRSLGRARFLLESRMASGLRSFRHLSPRGDQAGVPLFKNETSAFLGAPVSVCKGTKSRGQKEEDRARAWARPVSQGAGTGTAEERAAGKIDRSYSAVVSSFPGPRTS